MSRELKPPPELVKAIRQSGTMTEEQGGEGGELAGTAEGGRLAPWELKAQQEGVRLRQGDTPVYDNITQRAYQGPAQAGRRDEMSSKQYSRFEGGNH